MSKKDYYIKPKKIYELKMGDLRWIKFNDESVEFAPYVSQLTKNIFPTFSNTNILIDVMKKNDILFLRGKNSKTLVIATQSKLTGDLVNIYGPKSTMISDPTLIKTVSLLNDAFYGNMQILRSSLLRFSTYYDDTEGVQSIHDTLFKINKQKAKRFEKKYAILEKKKAAVSLKSKKTDDTENSKEKKPRKRKLMFF